MSPLLTVSHRFTAALFWQSGGILNQIWGVLSKQFINSPNMKVSAFRLIIGITLLVVVLVSSGKLTELLDRRISKQRHIDPGLRYTIARLIKYVLVVAGIVAVLKAHLSSTSRRSR